MKFTRGEKIFIFFSMIICFCTGAEYAITRPASNAIFITTFSTAFIPWVWLATVPLNFFIVYLYNRFLPRFGPLKMVLGIAFLAVGINVASALLLPHFASLIFFHFAWKDIYILFMFKQLWSMIHATLNSNRAKYLYGVIFGMGTMGAILGSMIPGFFAVELGSERLFFLTAPLYSLLAFSYFQAMRQSPLARGLFSEQLTQDPRAGEGLSLIFRNRLLWVILAVVIFMQMSVAFVEYQFNTHLELTILEKDMRTQYYGKVFGMMNLLSSAIQFIGSFVFIRFLGVRLNHLMIPLVLLLNGIISWTIPSFALTTFSFLLVKGTDVSLFGVVKEMLYIPLRLDEKYRAKAIIDVFAYRTSKAVTSVAILALQYFAGAYVLKLTGLLSLVLFASWFAFVALFLRLDEKRIEAKN